MSNIYSTLAKFASLQISYYDLKHTIIDFLSLLYKYNNSLIKYLKLVQNQIEIEKDNISNNINNPSIQQNTIDLEGIASLINIITIKIEKNISYLDTIYDISSIDEKYQEMKKNKTTLIISNRTTLISSFYRLVSNKITGFKTYSLFQSPEKINVNIQSMELELINNIILLLIEINSYLYKKQIPQKELLIVKPLPLLNETYEQKEEQKEIDENEKVLDKQLKKIKSLLDSEETKLEKLTSTNIIIEDSNITTAKEFASQIMSKFKSIFLRNKVVPIGGCINSIKKFKQKHSKTHSKQKHSKIHSKRRYSK